ncbi:MAG: histidinol-phosphate transaminase [Lentisphaerae bacterium]|nr:histidinol-phosphate transaminase [Lentisphaerota bacterium]
MNPHRIRRAVDAMSGYVPGEQPSEPGVVKLNTNENPYPPAPAVAAALRGATADVLRLYPDPVSARLCERIAEIHGARPDQVFVANGSDEILALCARAFVERDGAAGWFEPSYSLYPVLAQIEGIGCRPVDLGPEFEWRDPLGCGASLFYLTNPNAPTGMLHPEEAVRAFCARFPGVVLIDEAYVDFAPRSLMDLALSSDRVLVARTLSKSHSLAGLRLGYAVGPAPLIGAMMKIKDSYNVDRLTQELALAALSDLGPMQANAARIVATRDRTAAALEAMGARVCPSATNFLWIRPPRRPAPEVYADLRARGILVRHFDLPRTAGWLRVTVGADADMDLFLAAMRDVG